MQNLNQEFLNEYRELEMLLRSNGQEVREYESELEGLDLERMNRLRMSRVMRNYLSHSTNGGNFLTVSKEQLKFIKREVEVQQLRGDIVKKHLGKVALYSCTPKDKCVDVLKIMSKRKVNQYPVIDAKSGEVKVVSIYALGGAAAESRATKVGDIKKMSKEYEYVSELMLYKDVKPGVVGICTVDGTAGSAIKGIVK